MATAGAANPLPAGASLAGLYPFPTTNEVASNGTGSGNTIPTVTMTSPSSNGAAATLNFQANSDLSSLGLTAALPSESPNYCLCLFTYYILSTSISSLLHNGPTHVILVDIQITAWARREIYLALGRFA